MPKHPFWAKLRGRGIGPRTGFALTALLLAGSFLTAYEAQEPPGITPEMLDSLKALPGGLAALPAVPIPDQNPQNAAKIELGRKLFFDTRLSLDRKSSCATCSCDPEKGVYRKIASCLTRSWRHSEDSGLESEPLEGRPARREVLSANPAFPG